MQSYPRKSGEMQIQAGGGSGILLGDYCAPAQLGHDSYLLWQRPVTTHAGAHQNPHPGIHYTVYASPPLALCLLSLLRIPGKKKSRMMPRFGLDQSNKATWVARRNSHCSDQRRRSLYAQGLSKMHTTEG